MRTLMISLDQNLLKSGSKVAERLGVLKDTDIIVPAFENKEIILSESVKVFGTGGNKLAQFFKTIGLGKKLKKTSEYGLITAQDPFMTALAAIFIRQTEMLEIQVHGDFFSNLNFIAGSPKNWCYYWLARLITLPKANKIRVVGKRVKKSLLDLGYKTEQIEVRSVFLDKDRIKKYQPQKSAKALWPNFRKYFAYVGRLEKEKNVAWLIKTFQKYLLVSKNHDVLLIVGDGSQKNTLQTLVKTLDLEKNIIFTGWVNEPLDYVKTVDAVLVASQAEGYGLSAMEAAAAGTKLIMTDVGVANYELLASDKVTIVPVNNPKEFIKNLKLV